MIKYDHQGLNPVIGTKIHESIDIPDFDITPNGTTLVVYSSASSTISAVGYNSSDHSIVTPTFEISTYSGFSSGDSIEINSSLSYGQTKVVHVVGNKFFVSYGLGNSDVAYYKIVDLNGNVLVGADRDLVWRFGEQDWELVKTSFKDILYWQNNAGTDAPTSYSGTGTILFGYLHHSTATMDLEDLFNRLN